MKTKRTRRHTLAGLAVLLGSVAVRADYTVSYSGIGLVVPDGSPLGVSDTRTVTSGLTTPLLDVRVSVQLTGGYLGDLYVALIHEGTSTVLLNRPGRRAADLLGYADSGLGVTFSDGAVAGNVHHYRLGVTGSHDLPLSGALSGTWQPDGRTTDPATVLDTDTPSTFLADFLGATADGSWTLYLADLGPVGEMTLEGWSLTLVPQPVPEPAAVALATALALLGWGVVVRHRKPSRPDAHSN